MNNHEHIEERVTLPSLFKNRNFILILLSSTFTGFAFSIFLLAETWYVVDELNNQAALGLVLAATSLPRVLFMVFGGAYADRIKGSVLMLLSNFIRSVLIAMMVILIVFGLLDVWTLILFALLFGVLDAFYWPANNTIVPALIPKEQLTRANSFLELSFRLTFISGPLIAGLLLTLGSFELVFGTVVVLLLIGAICILPLLGFETEKTHAKTTIFRELRDSFQYASKSQFLIGAMTMSIITNLIITGPGTMASPIIVSEILDGNAFDLSLLEASFAIGMVLGALIVAAWNPNKKRGLLSVSRLILLGVTLVLLSQSTTLWQAIVVLALIGIAISIGDIPIRTLIQEKTDPQMLGRVTGMLGTASRGLAPISYMITAWLLSISISIGTILLVSGLVLICTACLSFWKLRGFVTAD
ncbi:MFS transporter [Geomicrobium sp. JCM 19055]|uniref:MFS transporter n=1 Tax=Geomicrobium sp. JCM 19055 TaxID=1460649 RepID=UPI00045EDA74|nr:MFS transporter [Geomicrobium sp. JCM 19055]GAJ99960.1 hypothetical protein JCM19055_3023 [Geomicrobium sp. JCM 19055]